MILETLILTCLLTVEEAFFGFSNPTVITVWSVFILSDGITRSGIGDRIAKLLMCLTGKKHAGLTFTIMLVAE